MSLTMWIEIQAGASLDGISSVLTAMGTQMDAVDNGVSGFVDRSHCQFLFRYDSSPEEVLLESMEVDWRVGVRGSFHYRADNLHESWRDIVEFARSYAASQPFKFVVSFQLETLYAVRDEHGLRIVVPVLEASGAGAASSAYTDFMPEG